MALNKNEIAAKRTALGLTQAELAEIVGISVRALQYAEKEETYLQAEQWLVLNDVLCEGTPHITNYVWNPLQLGRIRTARGMSVEEVARAIGVSPRSVHNWESPAYFPRRVPKIENVNALCRLFGVLVDDLFDKTDDRTDRLAV